MVLARGRTVELLFLPGIQDVDGVPFVSDGSAPRVLTWKIAEQ